MNKTIEEMWEAAIVSAGRENFEPTWKDVRDKFAKLLIEECAEKAYRLADTECEANYLKEEILSLGESDES